MGVVVCFLPLSPQIGLSQLVKLIVVDADSLKEKATLAATLALSESVWLKQHKQNQNTSWRKQKHFDAFSFIIFL